MGEIQVASSRKDVKSRTHGRKSRPTRTKATTRVGQVHKPRADLKQQLENYRRDSLRSASATTAARASARRAIVALHRAPDDRAWGATPDPRHTDQPD